MTKKTQLPKHQLQPVEKLWRAIFDAIPPLPKQRPSEWANQYRVLSRDAAAESGKFRCLPYQKELMDAPLEPDVSETVMMLAAQTGKSETLNCLIGFFTHADPSPMLLVQPTVELYEAYSKERIAPMIRDTPVLRKLVKDARSRNSGNTTAFKQFPGGSLAMTGANAPAGLAGRPRRVVMQDEIDRYPASAGSEGDPCALADKRAESFPNAVKVKTSTPTVKGISKIEKLYDNSDKRHWMVKCPKCAFEHTLLWSQVKWPENEPDKAYLECPACKAHLNDVDRIGMIKKGRWVATRPFAGVRGYWLNGMNTLFRQHKGYKNRLHEFAMEFLKAKDGGGQTMRVWINTFLAETFEEDATKIDAKSLEDRGEEYTPYTIPEGVLTLVAAADVQRNRIECEVKGFGKDEESWGIKRVVLDGDTELDDVWNRLDLLLLEDFTREDGVPLKIQRAFIDMGYKDKRVLSFCAPRIGRGVYPCKGINRVGTNIPAILPAKPSRNNRARIPHWNIGVTVAKSALHDRIALPTPGARAMHFAAPEYGYDADYFAQFASEKRFLKYSYGQPYYIFEKENNSVRNEALDLNVYALAAVHSLFPIAWQRLADNLKKQAPREPVIPKHTPEEVKQLKNEGNHPIEPLQPPVTPPQQPERDFAAIERSRQAKVARRTGRGGFVSKWRM